MFPINYSTNHLPFVTIMGTMEDTTARQGSGLQQVNVFAKGLMLKPAQMERLCTG